MRSSQATPARRRGQPCRIASLTAEIHLSDWALSGARRLRRVPCKRMLERNTFNSRLSVLYGDNVRLDLAVHRPPPEPLGDRFGRDVSGFAEQRGVARLDLAS